MEHSKSWKCGVSKFEAAKGWRAIKVSMNLSSPCGPGHFHWTNLARVNKVASKAITVVWPELRNCVAFLNPSIPCICLIVPNSGSCYRSMIWYADHAIVWRVLVSLQSKRWLVCFNHSFSCSFTLANCSSSKTDIRIHQSIVGLQHWLSLKLLPALLCNYQAMHDFLESTELNLISGCSILWFSAVGNQNKSIAVPWKDAFAVEFYGLWSRFSREPLL